MWCILLSYFHVSIYWLNIPKDKQQQYMDWNIRCLPSAQIQHKQRYKAIRSRPVSKQEAVILTDKDEPIKAVWSIEVLWVPCPNVEIDTMRNHMTLETKIFSFLVSLHRIDPKVLWSKTAPLQKATSKGTNRKTKNCRLTLRVHQQVVLAHNKDKKKNTFVSSYIFSSESFFSTWISCGL